MSNNKIIWSSLSPILQEKYKDRVNEKDDIHKFVYQFHIPNLDWINDSNIKTKAYQIFHEEYNELQLSINLFDNLLMHVDLNHEEHGINDFPIDMPREYFRFPALNNPKDIFSKTELTESENEKIELIINKAQKKMNIRNDENIVKEYYTKLEFISLFSSFEAYLENIYIEYFQKDDDTINATKIIEKAGMLIKKNSTDNYLKEILMIINPELKNLLLGIKENIFDFFYLAYLVRNIHTHKLGKTSNYFIKKGILKNIIKKEIVKNDKNEIIEEYFYVDCLLGEYKIVEQGKYFSLKELTALFRSYTCEIAYILDNSVYQNKGK